MTMNASVSIKCSDTLTLETMLERIHAAAQAGELDWGACDIAATLEFSASKKESFGALEHVINTQNRPHGVRCSVTLTEDAA